MERDLFDNLTRAVASGMSRRSTLRALFGGSVAAVAGVAATGTNAKGGSKKPDNPKGGKPDCCPADYPTLCTRTCSDLQTDPNNCGACGTVCPSGTCANGVCTPGPPEPTCTDGIKNRDESDIDCGGLYCPECSDGKTCTSDANCQSKNCANGICAPAPTCTAEDEGQPCDTGRLGICAEGTIQCQGGRPVCVQTYAPTDEICNGLDDDCDGIVDEGNPGGGGACNTGLPGICASGTLQCINGALICVGTFTPGSQTEVCNGVDDDCDGVVDNGATCPAMVNATGVCTGGQCVYTCNAGYGMVNDSCVLITLAGLTVPDQTVGVAGTGTATLTAPSPTDVVITLTPTEGETLFTTDPVAVVPAGQTSATFNVFPVAEGIGEVTATLGTTTMRDSFVIAAA